MAESAVAFLLKKLDELLTNEWNLSFGVRSEIRSLHNEIQWIRPLLKDADQRSHHHNFSMWVGQLRAELYVAENIIDDFVLQAHSERHHSLNFIIRRIFWPFTQYKSLRSYGTQIREIKKNLEEISANKSKYGVGDIQGDHEASSSSHPQRERLTFSTKETDVVGFEGDERSILDKLTGSETRRVVISIVGMGGQGKTTLAKKVYHQVKGNFTCHAWIDVSQEYNVRALMLRLIQDIIPLPRKKKKKEEGDKKKKKKEKEKKEGEEEEEEVQVQVVVEVEVKVELEKMDTESLKSRLSEYLKEKKYLIVVDDIWGNGGWDDLLPALPEGANGSRVMLTTRNKDVAIHADALSDPHTLKGLQEEECWKLFCKKAFPDTEVCPNDLKKWGEKIVAKCGSLPLAIVVLGGLLSRKEKQAEWKKVYESMDWQLQEGKQNIFGILGLSYNDLPYYLKDCFLYCGVYPEDFEIQIQQLIRLWIAEGFIQPRGAVTLEEVAEDYMEELIQRSMIQVAKKNCNGGVKTCRIHDFLRDLAISEAKKSKFFEISVTDESLFFELVRRLVFHHHSTRKSLAYSHLRTLLNFASGGYLNSYFKTVLCNAKYLRVLDLEGIHLTCLPYQIGKLIHLRYLGLRNTELICELPSSIGNLFSLHTLDIRETCRETLPDSLWNIRALRHLCMGKSVFDNRVPGLALKRFSLSVAFPKHKNLQKLRNLETLTGIVAGKWISSSLEMLTNLRHLAIDRVLSVHVDGLANSLSKLDHLHSLWLQGETIPMLKLGANHSLYKMTLFGSLDQSHLTRTDFPSNLTKLCLRESNLTEASFLVLEKLPKLKILRLLKCSYSGHTLHCSKDGFPELKELVIYLSELKDWKIDSGALPILRSLILCKCAKLKELPETMATMNLQELKLLYVPRKLIDSLNASGELQKIKENIPSVVIENLPQIRRSRLIPPPPSIQIAELE